MTCLNPCPPPFPFQDPPWRGEDVFNKISYGEALPRGPTRYLFIYHFWQKRFPFCIPLIHKWNPFPIHTVSDKNSWDTFTQRCFFLLLACLLVLPMLLITVNSPNLAHQHWEGKKTVVSQQFWLRLVFRTLQPF